MTERTTPKLAQPGDRSQPPTRSANAETDKVVQITDTVVYLTTLAMWQRNPNRSSSGRSEPVDSLDTVETVAMGRAVTPRMADEFTLDCGPVRSGATAGGFMEPCSAFEPVPFVTGWTEQLDRANWNGGWAADPIVPAHL